MRQQGSLLAILAAVGAFTYNSASRPAGGGMKETEAAAAFSDQRSAKGLADTFAAFDRTRTYRITLNKRRAVVVDPETRATPFDWAIAIVPDPQNSNMKLDFDRGVEMIQLAARNAGYQFERFWLPWRDDAETKQTRYVIHPGHQGETTIGEASDKDIEKMPGLLLFRGEGAKPLAVFLVSESPTAAIAGDQFRAAVRLGRAVASLGGAKPGNALRIIGPGFSGSLEPLAVLINSEKPEPKDVTVRTWTMDRNAQNQFYKDSKVKPSLVSMEVDSWTALNAFAAYARNTWRDKTPLMILTEEGTVFGNVLNDKASQDKHSPAKPSTGSAPLFWTIPFPRNLSQLRNATEKQEHLPGFADDWRKNNIPRTGLLMSLRQEMPAKFEVPVFSKDQMPLSEESVLFTIGDILKTNTIHYVGIVATDPLDTLFLARYLRSACPNIRIFTLAPDLLFEHGSDSSDYSGIIGVSAFPLFPFSQLWGKRLPSLLPFADHTAEAVYNAASEIFHDIRPNAMRNAVDLRNETNPFSPGDLRHLWITVAGRSGFEPIAVVNPDAKENPVSGGGPESRTGAGPGTFVIEYWPGWSYVFGAILLCSLAYCLLMLFARRDGYPVLAMFSAHPDDWTRADDYNPVPRAFYLFSIGMCLSLLIAVWLVVPGVIVRQNLPVEPQFRFLIVELGFPIVGAAVVFALRKRGWMRTRGDVVPGRSALKASPAVRFGLFAASGTAILAFPGVLLNPFSGLPVTVLSRLLFFFCAGSLCLGATLAASLCPALGLMPFLKEARAKTPAGARIPKTLRAHAIGGGVFFLVAISLAVFADRTINADAPADFMAAYRALDLTNGVSPLVPVAFLLAGLTILGVTQLRRMTHYEDQGVQVPSMAGDEFCPELDAIVEDTKTRIRRITPHYVHWAVALTILILAAGIFRGPSQTLEGWHLDGLIIASALALTVLVLLVWIRLILIWVAFSEFLQQLERHPIRQVFSLLPKGFVWSPIWQGAGKKRTHVVITRSMELLHALLYHPETPHSLQDAIRKELGGVGPNSLMNCVKRLLEASALRRRLFRPQYRVLQRTLQAVSEQAAEYLRWAKWNRGDYELRYELATKEETRDALHTPRPDYVKQEPATICGELVAFRFLAFINFVLWHIDNLVSFVSLGFLLLVIAMSSYAFRSRTIIDWLLVVLFVALSAGIIMVFAQADRDAILSRITGTKEGKLDRHFVIHLVSYGVMPALVLISTHFPSVGRFFFSWVKPALESIH